MMTEFFPYDFQTLSEASMMLAHTPLLQQMSMSSSDLQAMHFEPELTTAIEELTEVPLPPAEPYELEEGFQREGETIVVQLPPTEPYELEEGGLDRAGDTTVQQEQPQEQIQQEETEQMQMQQEIQTPPPPPQQQHVRRRRNINQQR